MRLARLRNRYVQLLIPAMLALTALTACGAVPRTSSPAAGESVAADACAKRGSTMFVEWTNTYTDLASLKKDSDLVVAARVDAIVERPDQPKRSTSFVDPLCLMVRHSRRRECLRSSVFLATFPKRARKHSPSRA